MPLGGPAGRQGRGMMPTTEHETLEARFQRIAASLPDEVLSGDDLEGALARFGRGDDRLLGFYTREGVHTALETYGILETLRGRGYVGFEVEFDLQPGAFLSDVEYADAVLVGAVLPLFSSQHRCQDNDQQQQAK